MNNMKRILVLACACVVALAVNARPGPGPRGPGPAPHHHHHHGHHGAAIGAGIIGAGILGAAIVEAAVGPRPAPAPVVVHQPVVAAPAPVVVQQPTVVASPTVVTTGHYETRVHNVWVEGRYVEQVTAGGGVIRTWQPAHYEQQTTQVWVP